MAVVVAGVILINYYVAPIPKWLVKVLYVPLLVIFYQNNHLLPGLLDHQLLHLRWIEKGSNSRRNLGCSSRCNCCCLLGLLRRGVCSNDSYVLRGCNHLLLLHPSLHLILPVPVRLGPNQSPLSLCRPNSCPD